MVVINGLDTNNQSDRADLRKQGYFIDNTGAYSPGGNGSGNGQRVGDTFSGGQASQNQAPNNVFLPLVNGTPQSPSNARTYDQRQPGVSYVGDSNFANLFGPGSYFFQSGGPSHYGWMGQTAQNAASPGDFMNALLNYANMTNAAPSGPAVPSPVVGQTPNYGAGLLQAQRPAQLGTAQAYFNQNPYFSNAAYRPTP